MISGSVIRGSALFLICSVPMFATTRSRRGPTSQHFSTKRSHAVAKPAGPRAIDDARATQIQGALVGAGYLPEGASGHWDSGTEAAMQKYQADNGWQTKLIPDSRAIIKLGLGPTTSSSTVASGGSAVQ